MKKLITAFICLSLVVFSNTDLSAQLKFFTGGKLGFSTAGNSETDAKVSTFSVLPYLGYSASEKVIVGLGIGYEGRKNATDDDNYTNTGIFVINPFTRYRKAVTEKFGLYGELGLNIGLGTNKTTVAGSEAGKTNFTNMGVYLGPGIDFALAERWVINAQWGALSYNTTKIKDVDGRDSNFGLNFEPRSINFALNFLF